LPADTSQSASGVEQLALFGSVKLEQPNRLGTRLLRLNRNIPKSLLFDRRLVQLLSTVALLLATVVCQALHVHCTSPVEEPPPPPAKLFSPHSNVEAAAARSNI
jgi:hypothetical protein